MKMPPPLTVRRSRATWRPIVPFTAPLRSSGTRRVAHSKPSTLEQLRHRSACAGAAAGASAANAAAASTAAPRRRPTNWTGDAGIGATLHRALKSRCDQPDRCSNAGRWRARQARSTLNALVEESTSTVRGLRPEQAALAREWKRLSRAATVVALLTSPAFFLVLVESNNWSIGWALLVTFFAIIAFRGLIDIITHKLVPRPSLYGADREALLD